MSVPRSPTSSWPQQSDSNEVVESRAGVHSEGPRLACGALDFYLCWECGAAFISVFLVVIHEDECHAGVLGKSTLGYHMRMLESNLLCGQGVLPCGKKKMLLSVISTVLLDQLSRNRPLTYLNLLLL